MFISESFDVRSVIIKLRSRLHKIIDEQLNYWVGKINLSEEFDTVTINESLLEDWVEMLKNQVLIGKSINKHKQTHRLYQNQSENINKKMQKKLTFPKPLIILDQNKTNQVILRKDSNTIDVYQLKSSFLKEKKWSQRSYKISQQKLKPFNSITYSSFSNSLIIIGGHKLSNPNIKSSKISQLSLDSKVFSVISNLPYGLSSHTAVFYSQSIYIIGGNKNHSIITRGCFKFNEYSNTLQEIACLNYPVSNANCIIWRQKWIYKFGGVGDAFGVWDNSPYIERYSIRDDFWQVVNPLINENSLPMQQILLANSNSYICDQNNKIFVFGGHSIDGRFKQHCFILNIVENSNDEEGEVMEHRIEEYGICSCEEVVENNFVFLINQQNKVQMYALHKINSQGSVEYQPVVIHEFS